jgi:uncharacterized membrane protein YccF (DUF307 family)
MQQQPNPYPQFQPQQWQQPSQPLPPEQQWQQQPLPSQPFTPQWQQQPPLPLQPQYQPQENRFDIPLQPPPQYQQPMTPSPQMYSQPWQPYPQQMPMYPPMYAPQMNNVVVVNINKPNPSFFVRVLWYLFIGWWLGILWLNVGYFFCFTVIGLPLGLIMLNRLPWVLTLRPASQDVNVNVSTTTNMTANTTTTTVNIGGTQQYNMLVRALYFVFVGSWAGYIWACVGYALCLLIVTIPLGLVMLNRLPAVITLRRN